MRGECEDLCLSNSELNDSLPQMQITNDPSSSTSPTDYVSLMQTFAATLSVSAPRGWKALHIPDKMVELQVRDKSTSNSSRFNLVANL